LLDPNSVNVVIYHNECSDGWGAAWAAWKLLGSRATYIPGIYGQPPPDIKGKVVICVDFSYDKETTKKLIKESKQFLILDHHKSAMIALSDISEARFDMSKSGAMLSWEFFHPGKDAPKFIKYIQDRDLWSWALPYSKEFSAAFEMVPFEFEEYDAYCDDSTFDDAIERGGYILAHKRSYVNKLVERAGARTLRGKTALVVNAAHWMSEIGNQLAKLADVGVIWYYDHNDNCCHVSLRGDHDDVDVSEISKMFGGGGHKLAAGFLVKGTDIESIFDKRE